MEVWPGYFATRSQNAGEPDRPLAALPYLGAAITLLIAAEAADQRLPPPEGARWFGPRSARR